MNDLLIFICIVLFALIPFGFGVVYMLYKKTIVMPVALMVFVSSMFCAIVAFAVSEFGFNSLYWAIPACLAFLVSTNAVFKKLIQKPLIDLKNQMDSITRSGDLTFTINEKYLHIKNEMGAIMRSTHGLISSLHGTSAFANEIAKENFNAKYKILSDKDVLGKSLQDMQSSLLEAEKREQIRKADEDRQKWITHGVAKFSDLLRSEHDVKKLGETFLSYLLDYLEAIQGGLFLLNDQDENQVFYELIACVAYDRKKLMNKTFKVGQGLVGRCAYEQKTIHLTEIPDDYVTITSGLGTSNPTNLLLIPAIVNEKVFAVLELASFQPFEDYHIEFLEKIGENIASSISTLRINEQTIALLEESKLKGEELAAQEEEMRQNMEELQATQEEMHRKESEMQNLIASLQERIKELEAENK